MSNYSSPTLPVNTTSASSRGTTCVSLADTALELSMKTLAILVVLIMALAGNSMVLAVIKKNSRIRTTVNYLILNMAISELLVPIVVLPRRIFRLFFPGGYFLVDGAIGSLFCKFPPFCENLSAAVSMQSLVLLAVERCYAVVFPFKPPIIGDRARFVLIGLTWFLGMGASSPSLYTYQIRNYRTSIYCVYTWKPLFNTLSAFKYELVFFFVIFIALPFVITSFCYSVIIYTLNREKSSIQLATQERKRRAKENRQITILSILVLAVFLLAWVPMVTYLFIFSFSWSFQPACGLESFQFIADFLTFTYPAVNPIIYYYFNEKFRQGFKELFGESNCCLCCRSLRISSRGEFDLTTRNASVVATP